MYARTITSSSGGPLPGAVLFVSDASGKPLPGGAVTEANQQGYAVLNVTNPDTMVTARYIGHESQTKPIRLFPAVIELKDTNELAEVEVTAKRSYYLLGTLFVLLLIYNSQKND